MRFLAIVILVAGLFIARSAEDAGRVHYQRRAAPDLDKYTNAPASTQQLWFRTHFMRMAVFSPYFDKKTSWYPNGLVYIDLYGIPKESPLLHEHPEWVLHDSQGRMLYIPWGCAGGTCPQYAGDVANPSFRQWWIRSAGSLLSHGYLGFWIDDVNMEFRVSDGAGTQVPPIDSTTGHTMTWVAWRDHLAAFVEQIRQAFPKAEIVHNSIWYAGPPGVRDADPAIQRQIRAADNLNIEHGIANDANLTGGSGIWSVYALFSYIDRIHAAGRAVTIEEFDLDRFSREYALAGYFLISSGNDRFGDSGSNPDSWWPGYSVDLGSAQGPRSYSGGVFQRSFSCGMVLLGEPGLHPRTIMLPAPLTTLDGRRVSSVEVSSRHGIILQSCNSERSLP
jgi:Hypothetical glycosyl hydrolase family 15